VVVSEFYFRILMFILVYSRILCFNEYCSVGKVELQEPEGVQEIGSTGFCRPNERIGGR
jgi:hypothetical protein